MSPRPSIDEQLDDATSRLRGVVERQREDGDPSHEDFYAWGWALTEVTAGLEHLCRVLAGQVGRYGDARVLRDDEGAEPVVRLAEARGHLAALESALRAANGAARAYHSAAGHIAVEVDR